MKHNPVKRESKRVKMSAFDHSPYKEIYETKQQYLKDEIGIATLITRLKELGCSHEYIQLFIFNSLKSIVEEM